MKARVRFGWLLFSILVASFAGVCFAAVQPGDDFNANTTAAAATLQKWYNAKSRWDTTGWWNAANCVEAIENAIEATNGREYLDVLSQTFTHNLTNNFLNEYFDDEGWWALAWIRAFDITGDARYLEMAKTIFKDVTEGWDDYCTGGVYWKKDRRNKNAIPNELFLLTAIRLHQRTPGDAGTNSYFAWALREWEWFDKSGMINEQNLVNDGLNRWCDNNRRTTWSYNQGVIIGGLTDLYKATGSTNFLNRATAIADAVIQTLVDEKGVLQDPCERADCGGGDVPQFKGIFIRYLAYLYDETRKPAYGEFLLKCAHSVWFNDRDTAGHLGLRWSGPFDVADGARHSSAMMAVSALAEPTTALLPFARGSANPAFNHEVGAASGTQAWTCNAANAPKPGFMLSGPFLESLSVGPHTVHFNLLVDRVQRSSTALAKLDVRENEHGAILASREIMGRDFKEAAQAHDFQLSFTNATAGDPLEFRIYWNATPDAPALTLSDVTVDGGLRNWTAANLAHEVGRLDGLNAWEADPFRDPASGILTKGAIASGLSAGHHIASFELKVDNFNRDNSSIATLLVLDGAGRTVASRELVRGLFPNTLWQSFEVGFDAVAGGHYEFCVQWHFAPGAPRLSQRSVVVK